MTDTSETVAATVVYGDSATVKLRGDLDLESRDAVLDTLRSILLGGATTVTLDLTDVHFIDSTGLGAILEVYRQGATLLLDNVAPNVRRVLDLTGVDSVVSVMSGRAAAETEDGTT